MNKLLDKSLRVGFYLLIFTIPLIVYPYTSELFEFNKMVITYALTVVISSLWLSKMVIEKRFVFKRSILDIPILVFLSSLFISTIISVDTRTSLLGYYTRFHGGLASYVCYSILYWAWVSNFDKKMVRKAISFFLASAFIVSVYGVLQHFGVDANIWVQDVKTRIFSSLGQPNWLSAWIIALIPITWFRILSLTKNRKVWIYIFLSALFFLVLLYTKSRSGLLGFVFETIIFWGITVSKQKASISKKSKSLAIGGAVFLLLLTLIGTPWTPNILETISKEPNARLNNKLEGPALETGGTESGKIREIVWKGAIDVWRAYPIFGSGVETFAYAYYQYRPAQHNLVSEWDYLYNKAHNEYLNFLATTGLVGTLSYLAFLGAVVLVFAKTIFLQKDNGNSKNVIFNIALLSGFSSILVTNFFGFSVVPVALEIFLFPAMAISYTLPPTKERDTRINSSQKVLMVILLTATLYLLYCLGKYWLADYKYSYGKDYNSVGSYPKARLALLTATKLSPKEAFFYNELSKASVGIALAYHNNNGDKDTALKLAQSAVSESDKAIGLNNADVNLFRDRASLFIKLSAIHPEYLLNAKDTLQKAISMAPTDPLLTYNLGLTYLRIGDTNNALKFFQKTVELKPDYRNAYFAIGLTYVDLGEKEKARNMLKYILENINPNDEQVKRELNELQ